MKAVFDNGNHWRAKIGYVVLSSEQTIQDEVMKLRPEGVGMHISRVRSPDDISVEGLSSVAETLAHAAEVIIPDGNLDVVCYACTSGSLILGEQRVFDELNKGAPNAKATSLITGVFRALNAFGLKKIVVGTPYVQPVNDMERDYMSKAGFEVLGISGLQIRNDSDMVRVAPGFLKEFALSIDRADADAIFISCGALRTLEVVEAIEQEAGKPVICSNQAMIWDTLRLAGINDKIQGYGRLFCEF